MTAGQALARVLSMDRADPATVLDVGAGSGCHSKAFAVAGFDVTALDLRPSPVFAGNIPPIRWAQGRIENLDLGIFSVVWCSHVLEHVEDVGATLRRLRSSVAPGGILAVTVPPMKTALVGGHLSLFTLGSLAYRLIVAGFDCSGASFARYDYNLSAIVRRGGKVTEAVLDSLPRDNGDLEILAPYFPPEWGIHQGIDGATLPNVRWRT